MPTILTTLLLNYVLPAILKEFVSRGIVAAEKATGITTFQQLANHLQYTYVYPTGRNGA